MAWERATTFLNPTLIVEDDAVFHPSINWNGIMESARDYDVVFLGGQWLDHHMPRVEPITRVRSGQFCRSQAYIVSPPAAAFLTDYLFDCRRSWVMQDWMDDVPVGLVTPSVCGQATNVSAIDGMLHQERWWNGE